MEYEAAFKTTINQQLVVESTINNMKILGEFYLKEMLKNFKDRSANCNPNEKDKLKSVEESIFTICSSTRIKKLLNTASHTTEYLDNYMYQREYTKSNNI
jgi:hypothetical protein